MDKAALSRRFLGALAARKGRHWQLARAVGVHPSTLSSWLHGSVSPKPWDNRVIALGALIGVEAEACFVASRRSSGSERVA